MVCHNLCGASIDLNEVDRAGTVESRIRQLVMKLETLESLEIVHPFIKGFEQTLHCLNAEEVSAVAQGKISDLVAKRKKEDIEGKEGAKTVYSTSFYIGLQVIPKQRAFPALFVPCGRSGRV